MKILNMMQTIVLISGFAGVVLWANDRYKETLSEVSQLSKSLEEAQNKLSQFEILRVEFIAHEKRLSALRSEIPSISKEAAGEAVAETKEDLEDLRNKFELFNAATSNVAVVPDGIIEVKEGIVYDLIPGETFVVDIRRGGANFSAILSVGGEKAATLKFGDRATIGPNKECLVEFISARDGEDGSELGTFRKSCS